MSYIKLDKEELDKLIKDNLENIRFYSEPLKRFCENRSSKVNPFYKECIDEIKMSKLILKDICKEIGLKFNEIYKAENIYEENL